MRRGVCTSDLWGDVRTTAGDRNEDTEPSRGCKRQFRCTPCEIRAARSRAVLPELLHPMSVRNSDGDSDTFAPTRGGREAARVRRRRPDAGSARWPRLPPAAILAPVPPADASAFLPGP